MSDRVVPNTYLDIMMAHKIMQDVLTNEVKLPVYNGDAMSYCHFMVDTGAIIALRVDDSYYYPDPDLISRLEGLERVFGTRNPDTNVGSLDVIDETIYLILQTRKELKWMGSL